MIHQHLPNDPRIVDEVFSVMAQPGLEDVGWLLGMVATFGETPSSLKDFTWNDDNSINITSKKRSLKPLHPQWVILFQLKEKQPSRTKSRWLPISRKLNSAYTEGKCGLNVKGLLLAYKVRKVYYTPIKRQAALCYA